MARLNSRRARAAKRRAALTALAKDRNWTLQVEEGKVRDTVASKQHVLRYYTASNTTAPRFSNEDVPGKRKATVKAKPKDVSASHTDSLRAHYLRTWKGGRPIKSGD